MTSAADQQVTGRRPQPWSWGCSQPTIEGMGDRIARRVVTVPDVVGLTFRVGREVAHKAGVALANRDPDGPPIAALAWPGLHYIVRQQPAPGTLLHEWDSVVIEVTKHGDAPALEPAQPRPSPPADAVQATFEPQQYIDLTDD